jgi:hypothetical protein
MFIYCNKQIDTWLGNRNVEVFETTGLRTRENGKVIVIHS